MLDPSAVSTLPLTMNITSGAAAVRLTNILVGDVWLGSGQSNMGTTALAPDIAALNDSLLRFTWMAQSYWPARRTEPTLSVPWRVCTPGFSLYVGVMLHFGQRLREARPGVPIGLLVSQVGGTSVDDWIPLGDDSQSPERDANIRKIDLAHRVAAKRTLDVINPILRNPVDVFIRRSGFNGELPKYAGGLFNGMIAPLLEFPVKGAMWYQGEANANSQDYSIYNTRLRALIVRWRSLYKNPTMPFIIIQLPNWIPGGINWGAMREGQRRLASEMPYVSVAVTIEFGDPNDIHPVDKLPAGRRAAGIALTKVYNALPNSETICPQALSWTVDGSNAVVQFSSGITLTTGRIVGRTPFTADTNVTSIELSSNGSVFVPATSWSVSGNVLTASAASVATPVAIRYAYSGNPTGALLYSQSYVAASPFFLLQSDLAS